MKTNINLLLIFMMGIMVLVSCSKDEETGNNDNTNPTTGSMTCTVDGTNWTASLAVVATNNEGVLTVTGSDSNAHQCQATIVNHNGLGTYTLGGSITNASNGRWTEGLGQNDTYMTQVGLGVGTIEITELTAENVKGTFSFTAKNGEGTEVSVTAGVFDSHINQ